MPKPPEKIQIPDKVLKCFAAVATVCKEYQLTEASPLNDEDIEQFNAARGTKDLAESPELVYAENASRIMDWMFQRAPEYINGIVGKYQYSYTSVMSFRMEILLYNNTFPLLNCCCAYLDKTYGIPNITSIKLYRKMQLLEWLLRNIYLSEEAIFQPLNDFLDKIIIPGIATMVRQSARNAFAWRIKGENLKNVRLGLFHFADKKKLAPDLPHDIESKLDELAGLLEPGSQIDISTDSGPPSTLINPWKIQGPGFRLEPSHLAANGLADTIVLRQTVEEAATQKPIDRMAEAPTIAAKKERGGSTSTPHIIAHSSPLDLEQLSIAANETARMQTEFMRREIRANNDCKEAEKILADYREYENVQRLKARLLKTHPSPTHRQLNLFMEQINHFPTNGLSPLVEDFKKLYESLEKQISSQSEKKLALTVYPVITQEFTQLATNLNSLNYELTAAEKAEKITIMIQDSEKQLTQKIMDKEPWPPGCKAVVYGVFGALVGLALGFIVGALVTGGIGGILGAMAGALKGFVVGIHLSAAGGAVSLSALVGTGTYKRCKNHTLLYQQSKENMKDAINTFYDSRLVIHR